MPTSRHHVILYESDWVFLSQHYGAGSSSEAGVGTVIREMVHVMTNRIRKKSQEAIDELQSAVAQEEEV